MKRKILIFLFALIAFFAISLVALSQMGRTYVPLVDSSNIVAFVPDSENGGQPCVSSPVYYPKTNPYADIGEGIVDKNCFTLHATLRLAAETGDLAAIRLVISRGANVNAPDNDYDLARPLMQAVHHDQVEAARMLIDNGANVNFEYICCMSSTTPLMVAVERRNSEMVEMLLSRGADLNTLHGLNHVQVSLVRQLRREISK